MLAPYFVLVPLGVYVIMLVYETYIALKRIGKPHAKGGAYLHATWESTHTFLILGINSFVILYSAALKDLDKQVLYGMLVFAVAFIVRAVAYIRLFYIKGEHVHKPKMWLDRLFAYSHIVMLGSLTYTAIAAALSLNGHSYQANTDIINYLIPGAILFVPLLLFPLFFLYHTKK